MSGMNYFPDVLKMMVMVLNGLEMIGGRIELNVG